MIKIGDVFSIKTSKGEAYFQYMGKNSLMGSLIRVLPGVFDRRPEDIDVVLNNETNFWVFFPVSGALKLKIINKLGNFNVPEHSLKIPLFRAGDVDSETRKVETWWLWDGERQWKVGKISEEQRKLPIRQIWNDTMLIERIEEGWLPERDSA